MTEDSNETRKLHYRVSGSRKKRIAKFGLFVVVAIGAIGWILMYEWNQLVPAIFGWHSITFFQALQLFILCRILFGTFRGHYPGGRQNSRWMLERWANMTPEERAKFKEGMMSGKSC